MHRARACLVVLALTGTLLAACTVEGSDSAGSRSPRSTTTTAPAGPLGAEAVRDRLGPSLALISTPESTGSAVLLDDGMLLTNAHVIDPYSDVDVTFEGQDRIEDVHVAQVDLVADLALVGPVEVDAPALELVDPGEAEEGAAFLVGFPGDQDPDDPKVRVTEGELDGLEALDRWDLTLVRSTTPIRDGQSGGALVDDRGRVIGISGLSDDEGTALSVDGADAAGRAAALADFQGSRWEGISPHGETDHDLFPQDDGSASSYYVVPSLDDQHLEITVDGPGAKVAVSDPGYARWPWAISSSIDPAAEDDAWNVDEADLTSGDVVRMDDAGPGTFGIDLEGGEPVIVTVSATGSDEVTVRSSAPMVSVATAGEDFGLVMGRPRRVVIDTLDDAAWGEVELEAGVTYEISARSASGDVGWYLQHEDDPADGTDAEDGGGGLFDLDAVETFTPEQGGTYWLDVYEYDVGAYEVEIEVREA